MVEADGKVGLWLLTKDRKDVKRKMVEIEYNKAVSKGDVEKQAELKQNELEISHSNDGSNSAFGNNTPIINPDSITNTNNTPTEKQPIPTTTPTTITTEPKKGRPEFRLPLCFIGMLILPCGLVLFGWSAANQTHWMVPLIGSFLVGYATILCFQTILVYLVDAFVPYSASATACAVLVRSILAAAFPLCAEYMLEDLGYGWSCTLLAGLSAVGLPVPLVLYRYGEGLRKRYKFKG